MQQDLVTLSLLPSQKAECLFDQREGSGHVSVLQSVTVTLTGKWQFNLSFYKSGQGSGARGLNRRECFTDMLKFTFALTTHYGNKEHAFNAMGVISLCHSEGSTAAMRIPHALSPSCSATDSLLMAQQSCMESSPHVCIPASRKREEESSPLLVKKVETYPPKTFPFPSHGPARCHRATRSCRDARRGHPRGDGRCVRGSPRLPVPRPCRRSPAGGWGTEHCASGPPHRHPLPPPRVAVC